MIVIKSGATTASIARQGAEIVTWDVAGRSLLWASRPEIWPETAPLLFPVVGWTRNGEVRVAGQTYPLALHGFARQREFRLVAQQADRARFELVSDAATHKLYPFDFTLTVEYVVEAESVATRLIVANTGDRPMPYACGLHPGFRWPFAGDSATGYRLRFAAPENPLVPRIAPGGLIARARRRLPLDGTVLPLTPTLFDNDALCFLDAASMSLRFEAPDGAAIAIEGEEFAHWGIWCRPGNGYLCIEQWTGFGDPEDFTGDLFSKPSMRILPPGATARHAAHYRYEAGPQSRRVGLAASWKPDK